LVKQEPRRIKVISAAGSPQEVFSRILPYLARLNSRRKLTEPGKPGDYK
jgi:hypothetical protein